METADAEEEEEYQKRRKTTTAEKEEEKEEEEGEKVAVNNNVSTSTRSLPATFCYTSPTYIPYSDPFGIAYPPPLQRQRRQQTSLMGERRDGGGSGSGSSKTKWKTY